MKNLLNEGDDAESDAVTYEKQVEDLKGTSAWAINTCSTNKHGELYGLCGRCQENIQTFHGFVFWPKKAKVRPHRVNALPVLIPLARIPHLRDSGEGLVSLLSLTVSRV